MLVYKKIVAQDFRYVPRINDKPQHLEKELIFFSCLFSGFRLVSDDNCDLLGHYAVIAVISYRRFGTVYRSHLQGSRTLDPKMGNYTTDCVITRIAQFSSLASVTQHTCILRLWL